MLRPWQSLRRASSSVASPSFSSYFFHNAQWLGQAHVQNRKHSLRLLGDPAVLPNQAAFKRISIASPSQLLGVYAQLSKSRLSILMVLSAMGSVAVSPFPVTVPTLLATAIGTGLCSAAANTFNQLQEIPFDAQMARTRNRPLVRRAVTPLHASAFGIVTGVAGPIILWTMVNPTTALLGAGNIFLYAGVYTWMKRKSIWNTWVGSVVGGIPPLMGWTATGGHLIPAQMHLFLPWAPAFDLSLVDNILSPFALFMLLYTWQFPHFNSLSYVVRGSYAQAGYRMLSVLDVRKNATVALRYAFLMIPLCSIVFPLSGLTTWAFALTSLVPNGIFAGATYQWWKHGGEKHARAAFRHSLWQLPVVLGLMMMHKNGMDWTKWLGLKKEEQVDLASNEQS